MRWRGPSARPPRAGARAPGWPERPPAVIDVAVEGVRKRYGAVEALRGVSLTFAAGRLTAILGPSGCGKTTLLRAIAGFVRVDAGAIRFAGEEVTARPPQEPGPAMVFARAPPGPHTA